MENKIFIKKITHLEDKLIDAYSVGDLKKFKSTAYDYALEFNNLKRYCRLMQSFAKGHDAIDYKLVKDGYKTFGK